MSAFVLGWVIAYAPIRPFGPNHSEIWSKVQLCSLKGLHLNTPSTQYLSICLALDCKLVMSVCDTIWTTFYCIFLIYYSFCICLYLFRLWEQLWCVHHIWHYHSVYHVFRGLPGKGRKCVWLWVSLELLHMNVTKASQITGNSSLCLTVVQVNFQERIKAMHYWV